MSKYKPGEVYADQNANLWKVGNDRKLHAQVDDDHWSPHGTTPQIVEAASGPLLHVSGPTPSKEETPENDPVNHPSHYTSHPSGIECIQITRHENFNRGNALKYWWRAGSKQYPGKTLVESAKIDYEKAIFYIRQEVKRLEESGGD